MHRNRPCHLILDRQRHRIVDIGLLAIVTVAQIPRTLLKAIMVLPGIPAGLRLGDRNIRTGIPDVHLVQSLIRHVIPIPEEFELEITADRLPRILHIGLIQRQHDPIGPI